VKSPLQRRPTKARSNLQFLGDLAKGALIVNGITCLMSALLVPNFRAAGARSSRVPVDARTLKPLLQPMKGCEPVDAPVVAVDEADERKR
jgi:hypothetical protein